MAMMSVLVLRGKGRCHSGAVDNYCASRSGHRVADRRIAMVVVGSAAPKDESMSGMAVFRQVSGCGTRDVLN